jgi:hypothetical protein
MNLYVFTVPGHGAVRHRLSVVAVNRATALYLAHEAAQRAVQRDPRVGPMPELDDLVCIGELEPEQVWWG